jgi:hypothetical protein
MEKETFTSSVGGTQEAAGNLILPYWVSRRVVD